MEVGLRTLYAEINRQSVPTAQAELNGPLTYCRALWAVGTWTPTQQAHQLFAELAPLQAEGTLFDVSGEKGLLHWTLFQLETFPVEPISREEYLRDGETLRRILYESPPFELSFCGVSKTRFGLFLCGYPTIDVNRIRNRFRSEIRGIREPHPQDICHATLFRFTHPPSSDISARLNDIVTRYTDVPLFQFKPTLWEHGFGTWRQLQSERQVLQSWSPPPRWILHRGLLSGPDRLLENNEGVLWTRISEGWDVEIDIWRDSSGTLWLGHDAPTTMLQDTALLTHPRVWVHCKNLAALVSMPAGANYFFHDVDAATLTSHGYVWCYPGNQPGGGRDVAVLPERTGAQFPQLGIASAVCSDYMPASFLS